MEQQAGIGDVAEILLDYVEEGRTFMGRDVREVPASAYLDPQRWLREMDAIFLRQPLIVAASCELPGPGTWKACEMLGKPILITRDRDGGARVFLNVCSHRGGRVAKDGCGEGTRFACVYHGWTFAADGRLLGVSDPAKFGPLDKSRRGLRELPSAERAGFIFAVLTPGEPIDIDGFYRGALSDFDAIGFGDWTFLGRRELTGANWKIAFDGYLEGYHFASLHPQTIHPRTPSNVTHYQAFGPHLRIGFPQVAIAEKLKGRARGDWGALENQGFDFVRILFPNVSVFVAPEITQVAQLFPGPTPDANRTVLNFYRREGPRDDADRAQLEGMMDWLLEVVRDEDYATGAAIQQGLESGAHDSVVFGLNERGNQYFHEWVDWLTGERAGPEPVL